MKYGWARDVKLETAMLNSRDAEIGLTSLDETRRCYFLICDRDVKVHIVLIAVVQLFFTFLTSWHVNVIINYRLATSISTHIAYVYEFAACVRSTYYSPWARDVNG